MDAQVPLAIIHKYMLSIENEPFTNEASTFRKTLYSLAKNTRITGTMKPDHAAVEVQMDSLKSTFKTGAQKKSSIQKTFIVSTVSGIFN